MNFQKLKQRVYEANQLLPKYNLVKFTWGNVSEFDCELQVVAIKPSGVAYDLMAVEDIVIVDMQGRVLEGSLHPSSDLDTHLEIYRHFPEVGGIVHTHSSWATSWAQARCSIPALGTTQADYFAGPVPCTRLLSAQEIMCDYELNTGKVIVETFESAGIDATAVPGVLVASHGPFTWGKDCFEAVHNAVVLEEIAFMAIQSLSIRQGDITPMQAELIQKHFYRKHGAGAYYGQK